MRAIGLILIISFCVTACDQKLSKEQRQELRDKMESREIKKISQDEIYKKALDEGRKVMKLVNSRTAVDSLEETCLCQITFHSSAENLEGKSKSVYEAYEYDPSGEDNIQKQEGELLIYSNPVIQSDSLKGVWFIEFQKKEIVKKL
ncbi:hypothetical protein [Fulvivirga lutea]|uniref:Uncharacterized protein n=1 Tax=Fulvivirga lutea TaxID=2810512 RepID=A0A974WGS0_9BACT|nr:hypothetical protein [Fulvivirga lutea]QSE98026.1 hypothetical protein JR347_02795 [Fulvivirga lutea]